MNGSGVEQPFDREKYRYGAGHPRWAWVPLPILFLAVIGLWLADLRTPVESRHLLFLRIGLNFVFSTLVALLVALKFGRSFLAHGAVGLLLFGCGAVIWGASGVVSLVASLVTALDFDPNIPVTIHNISIWTASLCQMAGAASLLRPGRHVSMPRPCLVGAYGLALGVVGVTVLATLSGWTSVFFVQGEGGTEVRWFVLGSTIGMLILTTLLLRTVKHPRPSLFLDWYILSLLALVIGYLGLMLESVFAGPLGWVSAAAQYLGGVYMFVASLAAFRQRDDLAAVLLQPQEEVPRPYTIAIAAVLFAAVLRLAFLHSLGIRAPFITFYPAVILVALYGGLWAGALATVISAATADYFWIAPFNSFYVEHGADCLSLAIFIATGLLVSWVADRLRKADALIRRAEEARSQELERLVAERSAELDKQVAVRLRAEEALRQEKAEGEFRVLAEAMPQIVWATRADGWNIFFNQQWVEYTGLTLEESYGHGWNKPFHPDDQQRAWDAWQKAVNHNGTYSLECRLRRADGQYRWWLVRGVPLINEDGKIEKWFGTCTDIHDLTWRKQVEYDLRIAKAEAERASLSKSKFLAAASHDLRQPVQALVLLLDVLKLHANTPPVVKAVGAMESALDALNHLLTSILDVSRIDAGTVTLQMQNVDVGVLLKRICGEYAPLCGQKGLRLRCRCKSSLQARTDAVQIERILRNLIENAFRYTDHGGLLIATRRRGDRLRIDIVDSGIGIPVDKLEHIFEEFYQVGNPARDVRQGLGLGLSIVRRLAGLTGADVQVRSNEGRGTCFTVWLALGTASHEVSSPTAQAEVVTGLRILVIEDNSTVRLGLEALLEEWGCKVLSAENGERALEVGEREGWRFDAIIADHRLGPGLSGTETAVEIGKRAGRSIPTLIVTGDTAPERIREVHASGFEMMHKPVTPDELARCLVRLCHSAERQLPSKSGMDITAPPSSKSRMILLVDDQELIRELTVPALESVGHRVIAAATGAEALAAIDGDARAADLMITDLGLPDMRGVALIEVARARLPKLEILVASAERVNENETAGLVI